MVYYFKYHLVDLFKKYFLFIEMTVVNMSPLKQMTLVWKSFRNLAVSVKVTIPNKILLCYDMLYMYGKPKSQTVEKLCFTVVK